MGLKIASTCPEFAWPIDTKISGPCAMTLLITSMESTTVKIEQNASPKWHLFLFMSRVECHIKNLALDQQVLGITSSFYWRTTTTNGSSFAISELRLSYSGD